MLKIKPKQEKMMQRIQLIMQCKTSLCIWLFILVLGCCLSALFKILPSVPIITGAYLGVLLYTIQKNSALVADISNDFLALEDTILTSFHVKEDAVWEYSIYADEIDQIIETKDCGFYIRMKTEYEKSMICKDGVLMVMNLIYVDGSLFGAEEFKDFYSEFVKISSGSVIERKNKQWKDKKISVKKWNLLLAGIVIGAQVATIMVQAFVF